MKKIIIILTILFSLLQVSYAEKITVGTIERQPFVIKTENGFKGFSIELWEEISKKLEIDYQFREFDVFSEMLKETEYNRVDLSMANISITSARERVMDFSGPIFDSGIGMIVKSENLEKKGFIDFLKESHYIISLIISFFFISGGIYLITKRKYKKQFYIACIVYLFLFVGVGVSDFTLYNIKAKNDSTYNLTTLHNKEIGAIIDSTGETFLNDLDITHRHYKTLDRLYKGLEDNEIEVIIHDLPILKYYVLTRPEYTVIGETFKREQYGVLFPEESELKEQINIAILEIRSSGKYGELYNKYFGEY